MVEPSCNKCFQCVQRARLIARSRGRYPVEDCLRLLESSGSAEHAELLLGTNPARLVRDEEPLDVAVLQQLPSLLKRLARGTLFRHQRNDISPVRPKQPTA